MLVVGWSVCAKAKKSETSATGQLQECPSFPSNKYEQWGRFSLSILSAVALSSCGGRFRGVSDLCDSLCAYRVHVSCIGLRDFFGGDLMRLL